MLWIVLSVIANATASILLKISSLSHETGLRGGFNTLLALFAYGIAFIFYRQSLIRLELSIAYPTITALSALILSVAGVLVFNEAVNLPKVLGLILISIGIFLFASSQAA